MFIGIRNLNLPRSNCEGCELSPKCPWFVPDRKSSATLLRRHALVQVHGSHLVWRLTRYKAKAFWIRQWKSRKVLGCCRQPIIRNEDTLNHPIRDSQNVF